MGLPHRIKMKKYRTELLDNGMKEPVNRVSGDGLRFYRQEGKDVAFAVNLSVCDGEIKAVCGFATANFDAADERAEFFEKFGVPDGEMKLREGFLINGEDDEKTVRQAAAQMYAEYHGATKDELFAFAKEKRKKFIAQIAAKLKPLGFKKKNSAWTRELESEYYLMFDVQKSSFSDEFFFNVYIGKNGTNEYGDCFYSRVSPDGKTPTDWQLVSEEQMESFLIDELCPLLYRLIETPLSELGKLSEIQRSCSCDRKKCEHCWVEKNIWEVRSKIIT